MSILSTNPLAAGDSQSGFSLTELMVAVGLGGIVTLMVGSFLLGAGKIQKTVTMRAELETVRSLHLNKVNCEAPCAGLKGGKKTFGQWEVETECHSTFKDAKVTVQHKKIEEASGNLFSLDSWVCKARRPKQCHYACHSSGLMLERGYLFPALDKPHNGVANECPDADTIGVDFSTYRVICDQINKNFPSGPMCQQDSTLAVKAVETHNVVINGEQPCTEHTQDQVRVAILDGTLKINLDETYKPSDGQRFVIIRAEKIFKKFKNENDKVLTGSYEFTITYGLKEVTLFAKKIPPK